MGINIKNIINIFFNFILSIIKQVKNIIGNIYIYNHLALTQMLEKKGILSNKLLT